MDVKNDGPLEGVILELYKDNKLIETRRTDQNGEYNFFAEPGYYTLKIDKENYIFKTQTVEIKDANKPYICEVIYGQPYKGYSPR